MAVRGLVAGAVIWIAWDDGSYALPSRGPLAIAIWWGVAVAIMFGLVRSSSLTPIAVVTGSLLAALAAWTLASAFWAPNVEATFAEFNRTMLYLGVYVLVALAGDTAQRRGLVQRPRMRDRRDRDGRAREPVGSPISSRIEVSRRFSPPP